MDSFRRLCLTVAAIGFFASLATKTQLTDIVSGWSAPFEITG